MVPTPRSTCSTHCASATGRSFPPSPNACRRGPRRNWPGFTWTWPRPVSAQPAAGCSTMDWTPKRAWMHRASMTPRLAAAVLPPPGRRLFDALLRQLPDATEAVDDLLQAGASPAGTGLLALALVQLGGAAQAAGLPLSLLARGADPFGPDARERTPL